MSSRYQKLIRQKEPVVMGILNVTPDSFSDGSSFLTSHLAFQHALKMYGDGALIIDVGGESTKPNAPKVSLSEELNRVIPIVEILAKEIDVLISIDTYKPEVMKAAVQAGAHMINDVRALQEDGAIELVAELNVPVCLMHMQGNPSTMQQKPEYADVTEDVYNFLSRRIQSCIENGICHNHLMVDVGFGFGKTLTQNYELLASMHKFQDLNVPILAGLSRKSMIGKIIDKPVDKRVIASVASAMLAVQQGAKIVRVHDVLETVEAFKIYDTYQKFR